jgi:Tol biopolymer transport system component
MKFDLLCSLLAFAFAFPCATAWSQTTELVSVNTVGMQGNADCVNPSMSADGRFVAFQSASNNLVANDSNVHVDVFVRDRTLGTTECVSVTASNLPGNGHSYYPSVSADGRYVAFASEASNLVMGDTNGIGDIFVRDRMNGTTERVNVSSMGVQSNGASQAPAPAISADGRYVVFASQASNLVIPGTSPGVQHIYWHDRQTGGTELMSVASGGQQGSSHSYSPSVSSDGRYVAFHSTANNLVSGDADGNDDVFVHDRQTETTECVSRGLNGLPSGGKFPSISSDGLYVGFVSSASNLVAGDANVAQDVFLHDRSSGSTECISLNAAGMPANGSSGGGGVRPSLSTDIRFVAFDANSNDLVPVDTTAARDAFARDRQNGLMERMSIASDGTQGNNDSSNAVISADGHFVAFQSASTNLFPGGTTLTQVFVRERGLGLPFTPFCFGDGTILNCPCHNNGASGHGCNNSVGTGGALLTANGTASLAADTVALTSSGELSTSLSIVLQGSSYSQQGTFGDGLRCASGTLKRLYVKHAVGGALTAP